MMPVTGQQDYARKYALNGICSYLIDTKDADSDEYHDRQTSQRKK